ncbi:MAG: molybdenum cofactor biosynthesis protein MoaE [Candidatus Methanosuratincola sp.]
MDKGDIRHLTEQKIDDLNLDALLDVGSGASGSLFVFKGIVRRDETAMGYVREIEYEAYEEMAEKEIRKIKAEVLSRYGLNGVAIVHRIGRVPVGEASLVVGVLSPHRKEGLYAVEFIIDEIKRKVPIWKKEIFDGGSHRWREGDV